MEENKTIKMIDVMPGIPACYAEVDVDYMKFSALNSRKDAVDSDIVKYVVEKDVEKKRNIIIMCDLKAGERDFPLNRYVELINDEIIPIVGDFVVVAEDEEGYSSLTKEEVDKYMDKFKYAHEFMVLFDKLIIFERRNVTELSMIQSFEINQMLDGEENG